MSEEIKQVDNIYQKLHEARKYIRTCGMKKKGHNEYSKFYYFTPDQVSQLVFQACENQGLIHLFNLIKEDDEHVGTLKIVDINNSESCLEFKMSTAIPSIKATNSTQQLGGAVTYTERYLLMTAFDIKDNNLDFDSQPPNESNESKNEDNNKPWLNKWNKDKTKQLALYAKVVKEAKLKGKTIKDLLQFYRISKSVQSELEKDLK
jgi:hypothetical protein